MSEEFPPAYCVQHNIFYACGCPYTTELEQCLFYPGCICYQRGLEEVEDTMPDNCLQHSLLNKPYDDDEYDYGEEESPGGGYY